MKPTQSLRKQLALFIAVSSLAFAAHAQSSPVATQQLQLSAFAAGTGTYTNLQGGKNLDITAGADLTLLTLRFLNPSLEVRGSYPIDRGHISSQKDFLVGPKVEYPLGNLHPYIDFLVGRGGIDYNNGGLVVGSTRYISSNTFIYSPGAGLDYNLSRHLAIKADFQYQHWNVPIPVAPPSGTINPKALSLGVVYIFDFNRGHRHRQ